MNSQLHGCKINYEKYFTNMLDILVKYFSKLVNFEKYFTNMLDIIVKYFSKLVLQLYYHGKYPNQL